MGRMACALLLAASLGGCGEPFPPEPGTRSALAPELGDPWFDRGWSFRKPVLIDATQVTGTLSAFPLLVAHDGPLDLAAHAVSDGADLAFALASGAQLPHELERYAPASGAFTAWVLLPELSAADAPSLYLYFGNPSPPAPFPRGAVWDTGHLAVYHLADAPTAASPTIRDSTANALDGIYAGGGAGTFEPGPAGGAVSFDGVDDFIDLGNPLPLRLTSAFTLEAWFNANAIGNDELISKSGSDGNRAWDISFDDDPPAPQGWVMMRSSVTGQDPMTYTGYTGIDAGTWHHVAAVFSPGDATRFFVDGALRQEAPDAGAAQFDSSLNVNIGRKPTAAGYFEGRIDEVRISGVARSNAWIQTSHRNQRSPQTFAALGPTESLADHDAAGAVDAGTDPLPLRELIVACSCAVPGGPVWVALFPIVALTLRSRRRGLGKTTAFPLAPAPGSPWRGRRS